ncbi:hypothetical protein JW905_12390 [bacterium]|nr:hypothetical protein [candidate division CSSED10-310 bacterium]
MSEIAVIAGTILLCEGVNGLAGGVLLACLAAALTSLLLLYADRFANWRFLAAATGIVAVTHLGAAWSVTRLPPLIIRVLLLIGLTASVAIITTVLFMAIHRKWLPGAWYLVPTVMITALAASTKEPLLLLFMIFLLRMERDDAAGESAEPHSDSVWQSAILLCFLTTVLLDYPLRNEHLPMRYTAFFTCALVFSFGAVVPRLCLRLYNRLVSRLSPRAETALRASVTVLPLLVLFIVLCLVSLIMLGGLITVNSLSGLLHAHGLMVQNALPDMLQAVAGQLAVDPTPALDTIVMEQLSRLPGDFPKATVVMVRQPGKDVVMSSMILVEGLEPGRFMELEQELRHTTPTHEVVFLALGDSGFGMSYYGREITNNGEVSALVVEPVTGRMLASLPRPQGVELALARLEDMHWLLNPALLHDGELRDHACSMSPESGGHMVVLGVTMLGNRTDSGFKALSRLHAFFDPFATGIHAGEQQHGSMLVSTSGSPGEFLIRNYEMLRGLILLLIAIVIMGAWLLPRSLRRLSIPNKVTTSSIGRSPANADSLDDRSS